MTTELREVALAVLRSPIETEASGHWEALVSGTFRLVDQFDCDGRRYLVAIRRKGASVEPLSHEERSVLGARAQGAPLRSIAEDLGLSVPTISRRLRRGMEKLGIGTQTELARVFAGSQCSSAPRSGPPPTSCV